MKQGTANLAEDYCFIHKALRPVSKARRKIAAVPPSNSRPVKVYLKICLFSKSDLSTAICQILAKVQTFTILKMLR